MPRVKIPRLVLKRLHCLVYCLDMDLKTYLMAMAMPERERFAARCGTTYGHLRNVAYGKSCAESLAINIDRESGGVVRCEALRPDVDFAYLRTTRGQPA